MRIKFKFVEIGWNFNVFTTTKLESKSFVFQWEPFFFTFMNSSSVFKVQTSNKEVQEDVVGLR